MKLPFASDLETQPPLRTRRRNAAAVLRFSAGKMSVAVAASAVTRIGAPDPRAAHIASILGVDRDPDRPAGRAIAVRFRNQEVTFLVDDPVEVDEIQRDEVVSGGESLPLLVHSAVIGFARKRGQLVMLLDLATIVTATGTR